MALFQWEKFKMKEKYWFISVDEILIFIIGILVFSINQINNYELYFIGLVIIWYWLKLRRTELKIHKKKQKVYNIYYDKCQPMTMERLNGEVKKAREPMYYELEQLETKRKFLVDKFVLVNLILVILVQVFIIRNN